MKGKQLMKTNKRKGGYSATTAQQYVNIKQALYSLSTGLEPQMKFEDGKPTKEIIAYKAWFSQEGLPPFQVKFTSEVELPTYMAMVELEALEACEVNYNVYFRASDIKEVK